MNVRGKRTGWMITIKKKKNGSKEGTEEKKGVD